MPLQVAQVERFRPVFAWVHIKEARAAAASYRDIFGAENYFVEIMDHGIEIERRVKDDLLNWQKELGLPLLATNDLHLHIR